MFSRLLPFILTLGFTPAALAATSTASTHASARQGVAKSTAKSTAKSRAAKRSRVRAKATAGERRASARGHAGHAGHADHNSHSARERSSTHAPRRRVSLKDDRFTGVKLARKSFRSGGAASGVTVFVNGRGARIHGGYEDSASNRSSIAWSRGRDAVSVPAFAGGGQTWGGMMTCLRDQLSAYDVKVTDRRPESGEYIMMMVGGSPGMLGYQRGVGGVAPYTGGVVNGTIGFIFADAFGGDARELCETVAHEIGHTLGLDHTYECTDTMSYLHGCGEKSFQDQAMACGEWGERSCGPGGRVQNSHRRLARNVGLRPQSPSRPQPPSRPPPPTPDKPPVVADTRAPRISMISPRNGSSFEYGDILFIVFDAKDERGVAKVELLWNADGRTTVYRCGDLPEELPIECGRAGDRFAFALQVGAGERKFAVRVTDTAGNASTTRWRRASFAEPEVDVDIWAQIEDDLAQEDDYGDCG